MPPTGALLLPIYMNIVVQGVIVFLQFLVQWGFMAAMVWIFRPVRLWVIAYGRLWLRSAGYMLLGVGCSPHLSGSHSTPN
jgi:hypothetical protein